MKTSSAIIITLLFVSLLASAVLAEEPLFGDFDNLTYPIIELNSCQSRADCELFCEEPENMAACLDFAQAHNLISQEEIEMGRRMLAIGETAGPGGCRGQEECEAYCDTLEHIKECITFAERHNLIPDDELDEARKVIKAVEQGIKPPNCRSKKECDVYCAEPTHMEECLAFGEAAGLIPEEELSEAKKVLEAIRKGVKPPNCRGKEECDIYCQQSEHMQECMEFGLAAGFIPVEEVENVKKTLKALKQGMRPPNCQGKEGCDVYCQTREHMAECMEFGLAAGFMPEEEVENARRTLQAIKQGFMPPNCRGEEECNVYCQTPEHFEECLNFSIAAGFMPEQDIENAKRMLEAIKKGVMPPNCRGEEECNVYCQQPEHMEECINFAEAMGQMSPEQAEQARQSLRLGQQGGPGGCRNPEECEAYCNQGTAQMRECIEFGVQMGQFTPEQAQEMLQQIEMQELMESQEMMPPPSEEPQSFLTPFVYFLASVLRAAGF